MDRNITAVILIVLAIGVYMTFTGNIWNDTKAIRAVNNQYAQAIDNADRLIKVRDKVLADYNTLSANDLDRLDKILPTTQDNIRLIIDLNNLAQKRGVVLSGIKVGVSSNSDESSSNKSQSAMSLDTVAVSFSVSATYQQFIELLRDLEANLRVMDVTHLSVKSSDTGVFDYSIGLNAYWLKEQ